MNNGTRTRITCLSICLALFTSAFFASAEAAVIANPSEEVDQLKEMVQDLHKNCWRRPARIRKWIMLKKLDGVKGLIEEGNYTTAYDKMLHDVKPKLTGLKTDENEEPWSRCRGNRHWRSWVKCADMREAFRVKCNTILSLLKEGPIVVDDTTAPEITVNYVGEYDTLNPGYWDVYIQDSESGLSEVQIIIDDVEYLYDTGLSGTESMSYQIPISATVGVHKILVIAVNYDVDGSMDQEINSISSWVDIQPPPDPPPPIIIG